MQIGFALPKGTAATCHMPHATRHTPHAPCHLSSVSVCIYVLPMATRCWQWHWAWHTLLDLHTHTHTHMVKPGKKAAEAGKRASETHSQCRLGLCMWVKWRARDIRQHSVNRISSSAGRRRQRRWPGGSNWELGNGANFATRNRCARDQLKSMQWKVQSAWQLAMRAWAARRESREQHELKMCKEVNANLIYSIA